jgi:ADP-ribosyl-[dinitrogen reductase] hydrolase
MAWHLLPIRDVSVPDDLFEELWAESGWRLRQILTEGGRVVLHCRGGIGRTGTIAARLLVEFGISPAEAIRMIRRARPGTIETPAQEAYVMRLRK